MNFFMEVAKQRAARMLWAKLMKAFSPSRRVARFARAHPNIGLVACLSRRVQQRRATCIEAMAATQGGTQSLHTNALDEAMALPSDRPVSAQHPDRAARKSGTTRIVDPWGGSYYVERLTGELARRAWNHIPRSKKSEAWRRRSKPACQSSASRRLRPRHRRVSTPASSGRRRQPYGRSERRSNCSRSTTRRCAAPDRKATGCGAIATRKPSR